MTFSAVANVAISEPTVVKDKFVILTTPIDWSYNHRKEVNHESIFVQPKARVAGE